MKTHKLKKVFFLFSAAVFFTGFVSSVMSVSSFGFVQPKAYADVQNNALLLVGKHCHELENIEHGFGIEVKGESGVDVDTCSPGWQNILKDSLGCSGNMFYEHAFQADSRDKSVTKTRWFTKLAEYKACYNKALAKQEFLNSEACRTMRQGSDNWSRCETAQNQLHAALGCDNKMFKPLGGQNTGYWGPISTRVNGCKSQIDLVGNVRIVVIRNGTKQLSDPIRSDSVRATPSENGQSGPRAGQDDEQLADCDAKLSSVLSWILCPIIDMASNTTDFIYGKVIKPMLDDSPVSTEATGPSSGPYKAWQGFRILGNIILIGAMLALVYGTTRGGQ